LSDHVDAEDIVHMSILKYFHRGKYWIYLNDKMFSKTSLIDCFGNSHNIPVIKMSGTGFCGYHALSFCLTGSQFSYD